MDILFWDIDGTILNTGRAGLYAIEEAFASLKGSQVTIPTIAAGGRTDNYICQQLLFKATGVMPSHEEVDVFCRQYETLLSHWLTKTHGHLFKEACDIISHVDKLYDVIQLLLTGNSAYGARLKLKQFNIDQYFDFNHSGFAEAFYYRDDLARFALEKVQREWGDDIDDIYVIGDTPYDIQCGKAIGAKTVAVSTGHYSLDELKKHDPWWAMEQLPPPAEFTDKLELNKKS